MDTSAETLTRKMQTLTTEQLCKVEELISSLQVDDRDRTMLSLSEDAFARVWNDPENDAYDAL